MDHQADMRDWVEQVSERSVRSHAQKRCARCVLPECTPGIAFDAEGICNYCHTYEKYPYGGEDALLSLLARYRTPGDRYDCIVTVSGGRDSTYTLLKVAKDYRMRVLVVNYENPFTDPQARANVDLAARTLGVDVVRFRLPDGVHQRTFKHNMSTWLKKPSPALVPMVCIACKTIWWQILQIANQYNVRCIVSGGNPLEYTSFKQELVQVSRDTRIDEQALNKAIWGVLKEVAKNTAYFRPSHIPVLLKAYLFGDPYSVGSRWLGSRVARVDLFHYVEWDEQEVLSRIRSELGWESPANLQSNWRFDCRVGHVKDLMYLMTLGMTERDDLYSKMIREGKLTRDEGLQRLTLENELAISEIRELLADVVIPDVPSLDDERP